MLLYQTLLPCTPQGEVLRRAIEDRSLADYSLVLVVLGRLTELAAFLKKHGDAFALKVKHVALFGAVCEHRRDALIRSTRSFDGGPFDGGEDEHFLKPDPLHPNHAADLAAAEYCYARLQQLAVPLVVVSKHAAYAAAVPATLYDDLARTNNPIARELRAEQRRGIDELWSRVNAPPGSARRGAGLAAHCDADWFRNLFCRETVSYTHLTLPTKA